MIKLSDYSSIILNSFCILLFPKLFRHNVRMPLASSYINNGKRTKLKTTEVIAYNTVTATHNETKILE